MLASSLAVLALSAVTASPFSHMIHLHPGTRTPDTRVSLTLHNRSRAFRDVKVGGHSYTLMPDTFLSIKAPAGTVVYADSPAYHVHRGDALFALTSKLDRTRVELD